LEKKPLQEVALKLIKKWHKHPDFQQIPDSTALLENIAKVDTKYAFDFLLDWIVNQQDDPILHQFYYPKLVYNTFKSYEKVLMDFIERLISYDKRFEKLIDEIFQKIISDLLVTSMTFLDLLKAFVECRKFSKTVNWRFMYS